jgi:glycosyltransferase involved in cell wall biosynthesis
MIKVLHVINTLSAGGAELHLLTLCRYQRRHGVEPVVACLREHEHDSRSLVCDFENDGIRVVRLRAHKRLGLGFVVTMARLLRHERPAIFHTHLPRADFGGFFARLACPNIPWVCSVHDIHDKSWSGRWTLPLFNFIWRRADRVIAISHAVKDWLVAERSVPLQKISVIHYGIDPELFSRPQGGLRREWGLEDKSIIGAIGRLEPRKGHDCLIRSMSEIRKTVPSAMLVIAGHDPLGYGQELQRLISNLGLNQSVRLLGFQNDIASFLNALDVFAFATHSEGFGQVVIEAMAAGKATVVTRIPPLTEIVVDGETGTLVEPGNPLAFAHAIGELLLNEDKSRAMGDRGKERVYSRFSSKRMCEETFSLYEDLLRGTGDYVDRFVARAL